MAEEMKLRGSWPRGRPPTFSLTDLEVLRELAQGEQRGIAYNL